MGNTGVGIASFGGGFAKGLTRGLRRQEDQRREDEKEQRARQDRYYGAVLPTLIDSVEDPADLEPFLQQMFPDTFGQAGKPTKSKAGQPGPMDMVKNVLSKFGGFGRQSGASNDPTANMPSGAGESSSMSPALSVFSAPPTDPAMMNMLPAPPATTVIPGTGIPVEGTPSPIANAQQTKTKQRTLLGVPVLSKTEQARRKQQTDIALTEEKATALEALAQRMVANGAAPNIRAARTRLGIGSKGVEISRGADFIDPDTGEVIAQGQPAADGTDYNQQRFVGVLEGEPRSKARPFFIDPRTKQITEQDGTPVTGRVMQVPDAPPQPSVIVTPDWQGVVDRRNATARPILGPDGQPILPRPTATAQERQASRDTAVRSIGTIKSIGDSVITKIGPAQRADAAKRGVAAVFGNDPNFRTYQDARLALAGNLAVLQQGSRPSDADIKAIWLPMIPDVYADTAASAALKWRVITVMSGVDPQEVANAAAAFTAGDDQKAGANRPGGPARTGGPGSAAAPNPGATATRLKVRQYLTSKGKQADEATINVFLGNPQNVEFIKGWQPTQ